MIITYFVNHYPKVSHTFIRREIQALESQGVTVNRIAIHADEIHDANNPDYAEIPKTKYILEPNLSVLIKAFGKLLVSDFGKVLSGLGLCFKMARVSDRSALKNLVYFLEGLRLAQLCRANGSEHIHAHFGTNSTDVVMYCSHITGIPYSFTVHGPEEFDRPLSINLGEKINRSSMVFAITKFCKSQLQRWVMHDQWSKVRIIKCGLDESFFDESLAIRPLDKTQVKALFIGRLCEQKGPLVLMEALNALRNKGVNLHVTFVGDGELREEIERYSAQHKLNDSITITGWVDSPKIRELLLQSDVMVLPSFAEGLPVAIMEAMASKVPVVSTRIAGIPELVVNDDTGFIVSPGCHEELAHAIERFIDLDENERQALIERAYQAVYKEHNASEEGKKIKAFIEESLI
ncbi:glycosyltransferase family 4 protein [Glaciecola sp. 2405UD65-10]|uniref:glycosyltransferase family 4 protein n=1 Tax=Glaciecola sp. 2405UD65-10 TaxID=3397244 RepID=UPI003B5BCFAD